MARQLTTEDMTSEVESQGLVRVSLTQADFETVLAALEDDAETGAREDAQDVLQSRAPRRWLQELEDAENAWREDAGRAASGTES